jgi:CheY-like chemotaxis protein
LKSSPRSVLIVENDESLRELLTELLVQEGFQVRSASEGNEALRLLDARERPDEVLLAWRMPGMGGAEFRARVRSCRGSGPSAPRKS